MTDMPTAVTAPEQGPGYPFVWVPDTPVTLEDDDTPPAAPVTRPAPRSALGVAPTSTTLTADDARAELERIQTTPAYRDGFHVDHERTLEQCLDLRRIILGAPRTVGGFEIQREPEDLHDLVVALDEPLPTPLPDLGQSPEDLAFMQRAAEDLGLSAALPSLLHAIAHEQLVGTTDDGEDACRAALLSRYGAEESERLIHEAQRCFAAMPEPMRDYLDNQDALRNNAGFVVKLALAWRNRVMPSADGRHA